MLLGAAIALTAGACQDAVPTAPQPRTFAPQLSTDGGTPAPPAPHSVTAVLPLPNGSPPFTTENSISLGSFDTATLAEIRIEGVITAHKAYPPEQYGSTFATLDASGWFDAGFFYGCYVQTGVQYTGQGWFYPAGSGCPYWQVPPYPGTRPLWVDTMVVRGDGTASRTGGIPYFSSNCGYAACYYYTGWQTITVTPIATTLTVTADPVDGPAGRTVTYTASTAGGSAFTVKEWSFVPDDTTIVLARRVGSRAASVHTSVSASTGAADSAGPGPCVAPATTCAESVTQSGTMYVLAAVLGVDQQAKVHVTARPDSLMLTAAPSTVKPGEQVTFTARDVNGNTIAVQGWAWHSVPPEDGDPLTGDGTSCGTSTTCTMPVYEAGTMTVTGTIEGVTGAQTATASVQITPCPPIDSLFDDPRIDDPHFRKSLVDAQGPHWNGKEPGGLVFYNPTTGSYLAVPYANADNVPECHYVPDISGGPLVPIPQGYVRDSADWHGHNKRNQPFQDPRCGPPGSYTGRGPSGGWDPVTLHPEGDYLYEEMAHHVGYLIDQDGFIFRWNSPGDLSLVKPTRWKRDGGSICFSLVPY